MQSSLRCTIMYTHLKLHETSFGVLWRGPYLSRVLTSAHILGKTGHTQTMLTKLSTAAVTFQK